MSRLYEMAAATVLLALIGCNMNKGGQNEISALRDSIAVSSQKAAQVEVESKDVSAKLIKQAKAEIDATRQLLPLEGGVGLIITEMEYDDAENSIRFRYNYTIPDVSTPSSSQKADAKMSALAILKSQPKEMAFLKGGISFHYDYYSIDNEYLYSMTIKPEDIIKN